MSARTGSPGTVAATIVLPADPAAMSIGGIASFVRAFVRFAPDDFAISMVGITEALPVRRWSTIEFEGRSMRFFPALQATSARQSRVPMALRFVTSLLRHGRPQGIDDSVLQFHRPATDLPFRRRGRARLRVVHLTTDDLTQPGGESRWRLLGPLLRRSEHASLRHMDHIVVVNAAAADAYRARWPDVASRIGFLPNFYDDTIFRPLSAAERAALRARVTTELGLPRGARLVVFAGRLDGQKDPALVVDAFAELHDQDPAVGLLMVGSGALEDDLKRRVRERSLEASVRLLGRQPRERVNELLNASSLMTISSRYETGPTVGYEALATGVPVVTTPVGEIARIVRESDAGRVVPDRQPRSLTDAMREVLAADDDEMRRRSMQAAAPFAASAVLNPLYEWHRRVRPRG